MSYLGYVIDTLLNDDLKTRDRRKAPGRRRAAEVEQPAPSRTRAASTTSDGLAQKRRIVKLGA